MPSRPQQHDDAGHPIRPHVRNRPTTSQNSGRKFPSRDPLSTFYGPLIERPVDPTRRYRHASDRGRTV